MVLTAIGDGKANAITETPVDMKTMMRGRMGKPQKDKDKANGEEEAK